MEEAKTPAEEKTVETKKTKADKKKKKDITVKANRKGRHIMCSLNLLRIFVLPILRLVKPFRFYGNKKVKDGACVYVCNHYALLDPMYPAATTWEGIHFIAKKEIFRYPVIGWVLKKVKGISANRDGNDVRVLLDSFKCLKNGEKISIFPEGTRNKTGEPLQSFEHGASAIAIKAKVPVVPMMIYKKPRFFRTTHILIGTPFEFTEYYGRKLTEQDYKEADDKIREIMLKLREEHTQFLESKKKKK